MRATSFKPQYRQAPPRPHTPPAPAWEPLSPVLPPADAPAAPLAAVRNIDLDRTYNGVADMLQQSSAQKIGVHAQLHLRSPTAKYEPTMRSAPLLQRSTPRLSALGSPIEALADAAMSSLHGSSAYIGSAPRPSFVTSSPPAMPHALNQHPQKHAYSTNVDYAQHERPAKRARSEFFSSPQHSQHHPRPATSHIPGWSYNVESMADNGLRFYHDSFNTRPHPDENSMKRLSDAQLLMDFAVAASDSAPQPMLAKKRWSMSQAEAPALHRQQHVNTNNSLPGLVPGSQIETQGAPAPSIGSIVPPSPIRILHQGFPSSALQAQTPPEEPPKVSIVITRNQDEGLTDMKPKRHHGWPKGKPRGPRGSIASGGRRRRPPSKTKGASSAAAAEAPEQLHSPLSLSAEQLDNRGDESATATAQVLPVYWSQCRTRRHSFSFTESDLDVHDILETTSRARSVPLKTAMTITPPAEEIYVPPIAAEPDTICAGCNTSESQTTIGDGEQWIRCDGCKEWYHFACAGFGNEREVRDVDKFYCTPCRPEFGETTKVRKSSRAHAAVDYAGLNEGILKTSDDNPEHHYISAFKTGDIEFAPETFARLPPEMLSANFLEKTNGFKEPILIPAALNPRPRPCGSKTSAPINFCVKPEDPSDEDCIHRTAPDDGQDKLDMVIPAELTVRRVSELYGPQERVPVIDVKAQEGEDKRWTMAKWADYYEQQGEKPVRNVISLEVSRSRLGRLLRRPKVVRDMDLQDSLWRDDDKKAPPAVQFYCLMSVADCYTDFHIDFGGSSVYYHIVKGRKVFFFIPPTKQNLKKYEDWCLSPKQGHEFLGHQVKDCYRVDLYPGDTMLIPSGWIHAVWTPEDSLVIGGNFLTRIHFGMQIRILEIEKSTKVAAKFRYPYFQRLMWLALIKYLEEDPLPAAVEQQLLSGEQFHRSIPIYCEAERFGHNSHLGRENYNCRYYSKAELEGLPELANYIWRTVLISLGRIEGITESVRKAVTSSIPKGFGEPTTLAQRFAIWIAWKKGNEGIPYWAYADAALPEAADSANEKKLSAAQVKRMEREAWSESLRSTADRHSTRSKTNEHPQVHGLTSGASAPGPTPPPILGFLQQTDLSRPLTTPKTSQLGPKRIACDACRKRRIRCKHKDEIDPLKPGNALNGGLNTIDLSGSLGLSVKRRYSDLDDSHGPLSDAAESVTGLHVGPLLADVNADPYALKSGRVKACADCRKSKRRCIHDEHGNVDPIKANEVPIPRGAASKKRRISEEESFSARRSREDDFEHGLSNDVLRHRNSLPATLDSSTSNELRSLTFSAQQAMSQAQSRLDLPIDPALEAFNSDIMVEDESMPSQYTDAVVSSIEHVPNDDEDDDDDDDDADADVHIMMGGGRSGSIVRLTPGPSIDGISAQSENCKERRASLADTKISAIISPCTPTAPRSSKVSLSTCKISRTPYSSRKKGSSPKSPPENRRVDSREPVKLETLSEQSRCLTPSIPGEGEGDDASLALAMQLQMEEHGLRRRSK